MSTPTPRPGTAAGVWCNSKRQVSCSKVFPGSFFTMPLLGGVGFPERPNAEFGGSPAPWMGKLPLSLVGAQDRVEWLQKLNSYWVFAGRDKMLLGNFAGCEKKNTHLCTLTVFCLYLKGSKFYFMAFLCFLDNSLKTRPNLRDKLCIFSTTQSKDKGNINVSLNYERELDCTRTVIRKKEFSFHLSSTFS